MIPLSALGGANWEGRIIKFRVVRGFNLPRPVASRDGRENCGV
jgi:hypothetical protein